MSKEKTVDLESKTPLYIQMKEILTERFLSGRRDYGKLPAETQLASEYGVNRMVVQRAMRQLSREGYLYRRPKAGTFISGKKKRTLRIACYDMPAYSVEEICSLFEESHPGVHIERLDVPVEEGYCRDVTRMIVDNDVDIIKVSESLFREFDAPDLFHSLNRYVGQNKSRTYDQPWNAFKHANTYYGFPLAFSPVVMVYNKNLFDRGGVSYPEKGWNWDDFLDKAKKLTLGKGNDTTDKQYGFLFSPHPNRWPAFILQNGGKLLKDDGELFNLSSAESREAIRFILNLMHKWKVAPVFADVAERPQSLFLRSKVAMTMGSYYHFGIFNKVRDFGWDIVPLPQRKRQATVLLADGFVVSKGTRNYKAALTFLKFTQSERVQRYIKNCRTIIPVDKNIAEKGQVRMPRNYRIYEDVLPHAEFLNLCHSSRPTQVLTEETGLLWYGLQSYEETCEHVENRSKPRMAFSA